MKKQIKKRLNKAQVFQLRKAEQFSYLETLAFMIRVVVDRCAYLLNAAEMIEIILRLTNKFHTRLSGNPRKYLRVPKGYIFGKISNEVRT